MTPRPFEFVTFDCYGTLIDWLSGMREAFSATAVSIGAPVDVEAAVARYLELEPIVEAEAYRSYREVLAETTRRVARSLKWPLPEERAGFLADSLRVWRPFPDTNRALIRLTDAGYRLGILSNVDRDLLYWTRRHLLARFEIVVTAEDVGSYKPAPGHFEAARQLIGGRPWLHVGQGYFHDIIPARDLGIPVAWINRRGEAPLDGKPPEHVFPTLTELADWLAP